MALRHANTRHCELKDYQHVQAPGASFMNNRDADYQDQYPVQFCIGLLLFKSERNS